MIPIPKVKNPVILSDFRGIHILCSISKAFERIVHRQVVNHLSSFDFLPNFNRVFVLIIVPVQHLLQLLTISVMHSTGNITLQGDRVHYLFNLIIAKRLTMLIIQFFFTNSSTSAIFLILLFAGSHPTSMVALKLLWVIRIMYPLGAQ